MKKLLVAASIIVALGMSSCKKAGTVFVLMEQTK